MDLQAVQARVLRQALPTHAGNGVWRMVAALGLAEEAGEVVGCVKKIEGKRLGLTKGFREDVDPMARLDEELGDALWQLVATANNYGRDLTAIASALFDKIDLRYGMATASAEG